MAVETLGEALSYGWRVTARCAWGKHREGLKSKRECVYRAELDMETLVWTRGRAFCLDWKAGCGANAGTIFTGQARQNPNLSTPAAKIWAPILRT
jgi:hypothetical protein